MDTSDRGAKYPPLHHYPPTVRQLSTPQYDQSSITQGICHLKKQSCHKHTLVVSAIAKTMSASTVSTRSSNICDKSIIIPKIRRPSRLGMPENHGHVWYCFQCEGKAGKDYRRFRYDKATWDHLKVNTTMSSTASASSNGLHHHSTGLVEFKLDWNEI